MLILNEQKNALRILKNYSHIFITGPAGCGKTFLVDYYAKNYCKNLHVIKCCFTGFATNNLTKDKENDLLGTIHDVFQLFNISNIITNNYPIKMDLVKIIAKYDVIIIDEISMVRIDIFEYIVKIISKANYFRKLGNNIQLIVVGDFYQLPPIVNNNELKILKKIYKTTDGFAFESSLWYQLHFKIVELKHNFRQKNNIYFKHLQLIRKNKNLSIAINYFNKALKNNLLSKNNITFLCQTNKQVDYYNRKMLNKIKGQHIVINAYYDHEIRHDLSKKILKFDNLGFVRSLYLKPQALVMFTKNDKLVKNKNRRFVNGDLAHVISCNPEKVVVKLIKNNKIIHLHKYNCQYELYKKPKLIFNTIVQDQYIGLLKQYPLKLAYGLTIHKAQGKTLGNIVLKLKQKNNFLSHGILYTALSRIKTLENLQLTNKLTITQIQANPKVIAFYQGINKTKYQLMDEIFK